MLSGPGADQEPSMIDDRKDWTDLVPTLAPEELR